MSLFVLDNDIRFPPVNFAEPDGLLAIGGDLSTDRILAAYRNGIFPWYEGEHILWWSPDPRFVLLPGELRISRSMKAIIRKQEFEFRVNTAFKDVIHNCRIAERPGQDGTWITDEMEKAYNRLHQQGYAHSAEAWKDGKLAGGLYGIRLGNVFFGESMFSNLDNSSKFAFISYVEEIQRQGVELIDCQVYTAHLETLGARMISRKDFIASLQRLLPKKAAI